MMQDSVILLIFTICILVLIKAFTVKDDEQ